MNKTAPYTLNAYADGFGNWHCEIKFTTPMGNTNNAHSTLVGAIRNAKALIRDELDQRNAHLKPRLKYVVSDNKLTPTNQLTYMRISEVA